MAQTRFELTDGGLNTMAISNRSRPRSNVSRPVGNTSQLASGNPDVYGGSSGAAISSRTTRVSRWQNLKSRPRSIGCGGSMRPRPPGLFLVAVGVAAEFIGEFASRPFERTIEMAREDQALKVTHETARLEAEAQLARAALANATARALDAELALEKIKAPRVIGEEQRQRIIEKLKPFSGMHFDFAVRPDPEPQAFVEQLAATLQASGWIRQAKQNASSLVITIPGKPPAAIATGFTGLGAEIDGSRVSEWSKALAALVDSFSAEGFPMRSNVATDGTAPPDAIHIFVGTKP